VHSNWPYNYASREIYSLEIGMHTKSYGNNRSQFWLTKKKFSKLCLKYELRKNFSIDRNPIKLVFDVNFFDL